MAGVAGDIAAAIGCGAVGSTIDDMTDAVECATPEIDMCLQVARCNALGRNEMRQCQMSEEGYKYSGRLTLRMPLSLHRELSYTAVKQGVSMNQLACLAIATALERIASEPMREAAAKAEFASPFGGAQAGPGFDEIMRSMGYDEND